MTTLDLLPTESASRATAPRTKRLRRMFESDGHRAEVMGRAEHDLGELFLEALAWSDQTPQPRVPVWVDGREMAQPIGTVVDLLADSNWFVEEVMNALRRGKLDNLQRSLVDTYVECNTEAAVEDYWTASGR